MSSDSNSSDRLLPTWGEVRGSEKTGPDANGFVAEDQMERAVEALAADGCVAFPTETVWGLAACANSDEAVFGLRQFKGRSDTQPISLLVPDAQGLDAMGFELSALARGLMLDFWPGALTLVLPCTGSFPLGIAGPEGAVALRCSSHPVASALARATRDAGLGPVTATSLNRSGEPPVRSEREARQLCVADGRGPFVLSVRGESRCAEVPSTVLDLSSSEPRILRAGAVSAEAIDASLAVYSRSEDAGPKPGDDRR